MVNDGLVGHAADLGEGGDGAVEGFGGEVADGESFVGGEAGGAEGFVGGVEKLFWRGVEEQVGRSVGRQVRRERSDQSRVDGERRLAVDLLIDNRAEEGFKGRLLVRQADGEGADFGDEFGELGVGGGESGYGFGGVVGELAGWGGAGHGEKCAIAGEILNAEGAKEATLRGGMEDVITLL